MVIFWIYCSRKKTRSRLKVRLKIIKYIVPVFIIITSRLYAQLYISPGIQFGTNFDEQFISYQITIGYIDAPFFYPGITFGKRKYLNNKSDKNLEYKYTDIQFSQAIWGFGIGQIWNQNGEKIIKYKLYSGAFAYGTYDYTPFKNELRKHNFGVFGVFPFILDIHDFPPKYAGF